jgi:hypothetical protein
MKTDLIKDFNLPNYIKGKSFSEASKLIENKFKGRNDKASSETKQELLERLSQAQEFIKQQNQQEEGKNEQNQAMFGGMFGNQNQDDSVIAGEANDNQMIDKTKDSVAGALGPFGQLFRGIQKGGQGLGNAIGGDVGAGVSDLFSPEESTMALFKDKDASTIAKIGGTVPILGGILAKNAKDKKIAKEQYNMDLKMSNSFKPSDYAFGGYTDPTDPNKKTVSRPATDKEIEDSTYQNSPDSMFNEYGLRKLGASMNDTISTQYPNLDLGKYKDVNYFNSKVSPDGLYSLNNTKSNPANADLYKQQLSYIQKLNPNAKIASNSSSGFVPLINQQAMGGYQNKYVNGGNPTLEQNQEGIYMDADKLGLNAAGFETYQQNNPIGTYEQPKTQAGEILSKTGNFLKDNYGSILRYAPLVGNLTNKIEKPVTDRPERLQGTYQPQLFDENRITNQVNQNNINKALSESSGGNLGALRSNLLASNLNKTKALGDAYAKASDINRGEQQFKFQGDRQKDTFNAQLNESYIDRKARDEGAYNTAKSAQRAALFEDIGAIGKEESYKKIVKEMFGYKWNGKYFVDKNGKKVEQSTIDAKLKDKK